MGRPRGYAEWNPKPETLALLDDVKQVFEDYRDHLPLTARQVFYRLVGQFDYDKTERAYSRLCEHLVRARRAELIPFRYIRDDGTTESAGGGYSGPASFWRTVQASAKYYERDRMLEQDVRLELWCEAAGMVPQLARVASDYGVSTYSTGGFSSVTVTHEIAMRAGKADVSTVFLHVGDYDPSGESIFDAMSADAQAFVMQFSDNFFDAERVALTGEQVDEHNLPTAPPKASDTRSRNWVGQTCQAEAMPPDVLAQTVRDAIEDRIDLDRYREQVDREDEDKRRISEVLERALEDGDDG